MSEGGEFKGRCPNLGYIRLCKKSVVVTDGRSVERDERWCGRLMDGV